MIPDKMFYGCKKLESVEISASTYKIGDQAFALCGNLADIYIPENVEEIGDKCFYQTYANFVIQAKKGSAAESYANANKINFVEKNNKSGWVSENGSWHYYVDGVQAISWKQIGGKWYYFEANGAMVKGWKYISGKWYYFEASGKMVSNTTMTINGKKYTFSKSGAMV